MQPHVPKEIKSKILFYRGTGSSPFQTNKNPDKVENTKPKMTHFEQKCVSAIANIILESNQSALNCCILIRS